MQYSAVQLFVTLDKVYICTLKYITVQYCTVENSTLPVVCEVRWFYVLLALEEGVGVEDAPLKEVPDNMPVEI